MQAYWWSPRFAFGCIPVDTSLASRLGSFMAAQLYHNVGWRARLVHRVLLPLRWVYGWLLQLSLPYQYRCTLCYLSFFLPSFSFFLSLSSCFQFFFLPSFCPLLSVPPFFLFFHPSFHSTCLLACFLSLRFSFLLSFMLPLFLIKSCPPH